MIGEQRNLDADWLKKRKWTVVAFTIQNITLGCDYGLFIINLWLHITKVVKPDDPKLYYCLLSMAYLLSSILFSIYVSKLADDTRNIRLLYFLCNGALILGNAIYMIPYSPWILLIGCSIKGAGQPQRSIMSSEIARSYPREKLTSLFAVMATANCFGFMMAPFVNIAFTSLNASLGKWRITIANVPGIYMSTVFILNQIFAFFWVHNLSKEYDMKAEREQWKSIINNKDTSNHGDQNVVVNEETPLLSSGNETGTYNGVEQKGVQENTLEIYDVTMSSFLTNEKIRITLLLKKLLLRCDTVLLLGLSLLENFFVASFDMCLPILVLGTLCWSIETFYGIMIGSGLVAMLPLFVFIFKHVSDGSVFYTAVGCMFVCGFFQLIQMLWAVDNGNKIVNIILSIIYCIIYADITVIREIFVRNFLAKMVSSRYQASADSIRTTASHIGALVALSSAPYALDKIGVIGFGYIIVIVVLGCVLLYKRRTFRDPRIVIS